MKCFHQETVLLVLRNEHFLRGLLCAYKKSQRCRSVPLIQHPDRIGNEIKKLIIMSAE